MASKKDFRGKKPTNAIEANAVEAFLGNETEESVATQPVEEIVESPTLLKAEKKIVKNPATKVETEKANDTRRNKGIHFLTTVSLYEYLKQVAWENRQSVNDYINTLIENDKAEREGK